MKLTTFRQASKRNKMIAVLCAVAVGIVGLTLVVSYAAGTFLSVEPEQLSPDNPATIVNDTNASGGKALKFGSVLPTPTPPPPTPGIVKKLTPGTSWQWQLTGTINETILDGVNNPKKMYDIDLYDTPASTISRLKAKGITVVCYFSAGSAEDWRSDYASFPSSVKGKGLDGWAGETWLDVRQLDILRPIMGARMDLAAQKGCDGVEPDNVDAYTNSSGFPLTGAHQLAYNKMLAQEAHKRNLSVGLKNDVDQLSQLVNDFDWALNEECYEYEECGGYSVFIQQNKAVFGVEYKGSTSAFCPQANASNYDWLLKKLDLGATPRTACRNG